MKKLLVYLLILSILTISLAALAGCEEGFSPVISDHYEGIVSGGNEPENADGTGTGDAPRLDAGPSEETPPSEGAEEGADAPPSEERTDRSVEIHNELAPYVYRGPTNDRESYVAACAKANVNVRRGAGTGYGVLFTLGIGDSLPYLWREGEWIAVWTGERVGYLSAGYAYLSETNEGIERTIRTGLKKLGTPYEWGATRRVSGSGILNPFFTGKSFDCSSFVQYCYYEGMGIKLGSYTGSQADCTVGEVITDYDDLKRGDFYFTGTDGTISHVVIYLGGGLLLQTYSANGGPVSVTEEARWKRNFISGRRPDPTVVVQYR
ncbi:MAG: C40 family peptidase [Clostridia bacterium]|nr:C40 family peptidase [Clostridia bacterium]